MKKFTVFLCAIVLVSGGGFAGLALATTITDFAIFGGLGVTLEEGVTVGGSVGSTHSVEIGDDAVVTGDVVSGGSFDVPPAGTFSAEGPGISKDKEETTILYPGTWGDLDLGKENLL